MSRYRKPLGVALAAALAVTLGWMADGRVQAQESEHNFIGVDACGRCHRMDRKGNQLAAWQASDHAGAYETLASEAAQAIATERGIENAQQADECLRCHTTAHGVPDSRLEEGFDRTRGVQCESCHGAGADYSPRAVMVDQAAATAAGLVIPTEATCTGCHNSESPTWESFDFATMSQTIAHPDPSSE